MESGAFSASTRRKRPLGDTRADWKMFAEIGQKLGRSKAKLSAAAVMQDMTRTIPLYAQMSYPTLAKVEKQTPDVGGENLYYGGTAYDNHGGLGVQWATDSEGAGAAITAQPVPAVTPLTRSEGDFLIVPVRELYDRAPEFLASRELMHAHIDQPFVILNTADANRLGVVHGDKVTVQYGSPDGPQGVEVDARVDAAAPVGAALLPRHLTIEPTPAVPVVGTVKKVEVPIHVSN